MHRWRARSVVVGLVVICSAAAAGSPSPRHEEWEQSSAMTAGQSDKGSSPVATVADALRRIRALEARSRKQHEQLLEDTQALADAYDGLVQQNADRIAEIATLKKEMAVIRAELSALKAGPRD
jgi:hypothetical protein